jgi:hypothetical protein
MLGVMTMKPCSANTAGFHLVDQLSPQAPCGPPWMRYATGYFFEASKLLGLTTHECTSLFTFGLLAGVQIDETCLVLRPNLLPWLELECVHSDDIDASDCSSEISMMANKELSIKDELV